MGAVGRRKGSLLVLAMLVVLVGAGCGSDEPADTGAQGGSGTEVTGLVSDGTLTVGTELPAPPFWIGEDYDSLTGGFEVDLAKEIAKRLNLANVKFVEMTFAGLVAGQQCPCDINFSQVTITEDRAKVVQFTEPYFDANQGFLIAKGGPAEGVQSIADMKGLLFGFQAATTGGAYIQDKIQPDEQPREVTTLPAATQALANGQIDAFLMDVAIGSQIVKARGEQIAMPGQFKTDEQY
ncbi:MAG: ABC transporter substrate-binding protein, partial [Actinomycetota bacterium]